MGERGITRTEVIATILAVVILGTVVTIVVAGRDDRMMRNQANLLEIHQAMVVFAAEYQGRYPVPGLQARLPVPGLGYVPGLGEEDFSRNTTANLYALLVGSNYCGPALLLSPYERNPLVAQPAAAGTWKPAQPITWPENPFGATLTADLERGSNVSYAHTPIAGQRGRRIWRDTQNPSICVLGNRGPASGVASADSYACLEDGRWAGSLVLADNHADTFFAAPGRPIRSATLGDADNPFFGDSLDLDHDAVIAFTVRATAEGPILQHD